MRILAVQPSIRARTLSAVGELHEQNVAGDIEDRADSPLPVGYGHLHRTDPSF